MRKNVLFYLIAACLLTVSIYFFNIAYKQVIEYARLTERGNLVHRSFQNLSTHITNAAVINPSLNAANETYLGAQTARP